MAKSTMTLEAVRARTQDVGLAKIDAMTQDDIRRHMREDGFDPDDTLSDDDVISPAVIRKRIDLSQRRFADAIHRPVATLRNWEQGWTLMDPSAWALMIILACEPEAALRTLGRYRAA